MRKRNNGFFMISMDQVWKLLVIAGILLIGLFFAFPERSAAAASDGTDDTIGAAADNPILVVTDEEFGANGSDTELDRRQIQAALSRARQELLENPSSQKVITVQIPDGTYYLDSPLYIYSNTHLILSEKATLVRQNIDSGMLYAHDVQYNSVGAVGGYELAQNITIEGGVFDGGDLSGATKDTKATDLLRIDHSSDIKIKNITFQNVYDCHHLEFIAVKNGTVEGCTFRNFVYKKGGEGNYNNAHEAFQIEGAASDHGVPWANETYEDGLGCRDITVRNCTFDNVPCGVGQHHVLYNDTGRNYNITITGNRFTLTNGNTATKPAINTCQMDGVSIKNNTISGTFRQGVFLRNSRNIEIDSNTIEKVTGIGIYADDHEQSASVATPYMTALSITNNKIQNVSQDGISIWQGKCSLISGNNISSTGENGITISNQAETASIRANSIQSTSDYGISISNAAVTNGISGNTITQTGLGAITLGDTARVSAIEQNSIKTPGTFGISVTEKASVTGSAGISRNRIDQPKKSGITVAGTVTTIANNTIPSAKEFAVSIPGGKVTGKNGIYKNTITKPAKSGISVAGGKITGANGIYQNSISQTKQNGITLSNGANVKTIHSNSISASGAQGISLVSKAVISGSKGIYANKISKPKKNAITISQKSTCAAIANNTITAPGGFGISIPEGSITGKTGISNNKITKPKKAALSIVKSTVKGNGIYKNTITDGKENLINVSGKSKVAVIASNVLKNAGGQAISVQDSSITGKKGVSGNKITTAKKNGIAVGGSSVIPGISSNTISSCSLSGITVTGKSKVTAVAKNSLKKCKKGIQIKVKGVKLSKNKIQK